MTISNNAQLAKAFDAQSAEPRLYELWERSGCFRPEAAKNQSAPVFNIAMPPPNANGELHIGHTYGYTFMDVLGRFYRMKGHRVLLLPGKDHAGIQTQVVFEKKLRTEGVRIEEKSTQWMYDQCYNFCIDRAQYMRNQEKTIGLSADWSRELFTLDPRLNSIVFETFEKLWADGLVYRGSRIVNWSVFSQTGISDVEVEYREQEGSLWYLCYRLADGPSSSNAAPQTLPSGGRFVIGQPGIVTATTRPETMLGDTALAVHPDDDRYKQFIGKKAIVPLVNRAIPIIADQRVDPAYGTGVIKVTPAHDFADFDIGMDHKLEVIQVIGKDGLMTDAAGATFAGMKTSVCREAVVEALKAENALLDITPIRHKVPIGERGKDIIEPLISEQWFLAVDKPGNSLKERALELVRSGKLAVHPEPFRKLIEQWLVNLRDWNISRQLWWGHRIPVWYREGASGRETYVGRSAPKGEGWEQETDVFDTWFSSGQWAYSTMAAHQLMQLEEGRSSSDFFPTHTMVMGRDILFFWACRMLLMTAYRVQDVPWRNIYFTGLIRDEHGQKMSKSKGNGVEPGDMITKYGADALRLSMLMGSSPGSDLNFSERKLQGYHKFINKLWNAAKLLEMKLGPLQPMFETVQPAITLESNRWILGQLKAVHSIVTKKMQEYEMAIAIDEVYRFTWTVFCDWYLEMLKSLLDKGPKEWHAETYFTARHCFQQILTLLHPFIPFVTEELFQNLSIVKDGAVLALRDWDCAVEVTPCNEAEMRGAMEVVSAVRSVKTTLGIPHKEIRIALSHQFKAELTLLIQSLGRVTIGGSSEIAEELALRKPVSVGSVVCEVEGKERYRERLSKEIEKHRETIQQLEAKLAGDFGTQAKPELIEREHERLNQSRAALEELEKELAC